MNSAWPDSRGQAEARRPQGQPALAAPQPTANRYRSAPLCLATGERRFRRTTTGRE